MTATTEHASAQPVGTSEPKQRTRKGIAALAHIGGLFTSILVPLALYFAFRDKDQFVREHSAKAVNFHICVIVVSVLLLVFWQFSPDLVGSETRDAENFVEGVEPLTVWGFILLGLVTAISAIIGTIRALLVKPFNYPLAPNFID